MFASSLFFSGLLSSALAVAKYDEYILTPSSRKIHPSSVYNINGTVDGSESLIASSSGSAIFHDFSAVTYDYGKNIGGIVSLTIGAISDTDQLIGITFSESSLWISGEWSDATADEGNDVSLFFYPSGPGVYTVGEQYQRGGFRYLSLVHNTTGSLEVQKIEVNYTAVPHIEEAQMRAYSGWFHSDELLDTNDGSDELINRIWYAGAYTAQLCTLDPHYGNSLNFLTDPENNPSTPVNGVVNWYSNTTIANASSVLADGAKRDRLVWPGDMVVSWPSMLVSTNDKVTVTNSLTSLFDRQNMTTGVMPYAGVPFPFMYSATYHLHSLIGTAEIYVYDGDLEFVREKWEQWKFALAYSLSTIDETGLINVTSSADWLRFGMGGHNIEANAILYHTLNYGVILAEALNDTSVITTYQNYAANIKSAAQDLLWDPSANLFRDNETTSLHPQDGNAWAVLANLTTSSSQAASISQSLISRWTTYGAPAPEAGPTVSPFVGFFELQAHAAAHNASAVLALTRLQWGFMLDDARMTNSTFIEGYSTDGSLHYAPYRNDPRVSHAHGWSTGPTSVLTFQIAGVQIVKAGGREWRIAPRLGGLGHTHAGFETSLGVFAARTKLGEGGELRIEFEAPEGTVGRLSVERPRCAGMMVLEGRCGREEFAIRENEGDVGDFEIAGLGGGEWVLTFGCA
ncbi:bacterial alpha-L-rhamnosidase domain-containing protein [Pseudovirgaria hyperparasitica]|uniref:Bacterial alpha-L-rhamnosidase domain-containing protein n=1 Tax=Pseudovirgaria hyperparasitica TaxID=470096 RepID=A0A6A6WBC7_9PEZI|nr:bacterial alpha-L-rhamnosidase domain-containing protein [Pseudovirgaria hyperparasitica]KAF2758411.1 bacterial alpha-L-rhamnosidase domain-containing protein [Pseudovirgaria hyperparasitica]